jgi:lipid A 3-O-deacylase
MLTNMRNFSSFILIAVLMSFQNIQAAGPGAMSATEEETRRATIPPWSVWSLGFDASALWSVGGNASPLDYSLAGLMVTAKTPAQFHWEVGSGDLVVRGGYSFQGAGFVDGPENYFVGLMGGPSLEWWSHSHKWAIYATAGGGFGLLDAKGYEVAGGQGQDFNFTWFAQGGLYYHFTPEIKLHLGARFQHISNGGMDDVNPGLDAFGPVIGIHWDFLMLAQMPSAESRMH